MPPVSLPMKGSGVEVQREINGLDPVAIIPVGLFHAGQLGFRVAGYSGMPPNGVRAIRVERRRLQERIGYAPQTVLRHVFMSCLDWHRDHCGE